MNDGQYTYRGITLNDTAGNYVVQSAQGLLELPDFKAVSYELYDDDGGTAALELLSMRTISLDIAIRDTSESNLQTKLRNLRKIFQPPDTNLSPPPTFPFNFQRPGLGELTINARSKRFAGFQTDYKLARAIAYGTLQLLAPDPRIMSVTELSQTLTIPASATSVSGTINQVGDFYSGAWPIVEIDGPTTNARIANADDGNRQFKIDMVINAGQTLIVDFAKRTATLGGVDQYSNIRTDNQWCD